MKITIIGAGIGGLTTAIALRKFRPDLELEIFEGSSELKAIGAGLGLGANAVLGYEQLGMKEKVLAVSNVLDCLQIRHFKGQVISRVDNLAINHNLQTISNFSIHRADLQRVLLDAAADVPLFLGKKLTHFLAEEDSVKLRFSDGLEWETDFVIAADGIRSVFRQKLLPDSKIRFAGYTCWRGVAPALPEGWPSKTAAEMVGLGKRFGIVPLPKNRVYWFAVVNANEPDDKRFAGMGKSGLLEQFGAFAQPVRVLVESTPAEEILHNDIMDFVPIGRFAFGRILLLGDAAHATTPNMGQGACQAIESAVILGKTLSKNEAVEPAFFEFEQRRLKRTAFIVNRSWQLGKVMQTANPLLAGIRNTLFRLIPQQVNERQVKSLLEVEF